MMIILINLQLCLTSKCDHTDHALMNVYENFQPIYQIGVPFTVQISYA